MQRSSLGEEEAIDPRERPCSRGWVDARKPTAARATGQLAFAVGNVLLPLRNLSDLRDSDLAAQWVAAHWATGYEDRESMDGLFLRINALTRLARRACRLFDWFFLGTGNWRCRYCGATPT